MFASLNTFLFIRLLFYDIAGDLKGQDTLKKKRIKHSHLALVFPSSEVCVLL